MSRLSNLLFPQSPLPILIVEADSLKISEVNAAASLLLGHPKESFSDQPLKSIFAFGEFSKLKTVLERGPGPHSVAVKMQRGKGEPFHAECRISLLDAGG